MRAVTGLRFTMGLLAWLVLAAQAQPVATSQTIVSTPMGQVAGVLRHGVLEFRAIPYAQAPVGDRRWAPPEPARPWSGVLDATHFKPACPQEARFNITEASDNEDCLYLDVSVALSQQGNRQVGLPVVVWLHGGALLGGSSSLYRLDRIARQTNAVVVAVNYRLGVLGFLAHPGLDPNHNGSFGLEDQRLALRWVKDNIAAFGGDANNVTVMGESAGGASVCTLLRTPDQSAGLFEKAIVLSSACTHPWRSIEEGNRFGLQVAQAVGCEDPSTALACLRRQDPMRLVKAASALPNPDPTPFAPVTGTSRLPDQTNRAFQTGQFLPVPLILGNTRDELALYLAYEAQAGRPVTAENYATWLQFLYGDKADAVLRVYPLANDLSPSAALGAAVSAFSPGFIVSQCLTLDSARRASGRVPVYVLDFADRTTPKAGVLIAAQPDPGMAMGAVHSTPLSYLFPGFSSTRAMNGPGLSADSQRSADLLLAYLADFIRNGDPNGSARPVWPRFKPPSNQALRVDDQGVQTVQPGRDYQCDFWQALYSSEFEGQRKHPMSRVPPAERLHQR